MSCAVALQAFSGAGMACRRLCQILKPCHFSVWETELVLFDRGEGVSGLSVARVVPNGVDAAEGCFLVITPVPGVNFRYP